MNPLIVLLLALAFAFPLQAQKDPLSRQWNEPVPPFRIAGNLYYVGAKDIASYLITTPKGHILVDGGFEETAPIILRNLDSLGFRIADVRILIGSHAHYDHAGGLAALKKASGARFFASAGDAPYYESGGRNDPQFGDRLTFPPVAVDRILADGDRVELGGVVLTARLTPGHTPGCISWTFSVNDSGKRREVVILGSPTAPEGFRLVDNPRYPNIIADYRRQFALLRSLHPDIFLASHGMFFDLEEKRTQGKTFVDPEGYRAYVALSEKRFEDKVRAQSIAAHGLVLHNATVIDGTGAGPRAAMDAIVREEKIVDVVPSATAQHPDGAYVVDAAGKFVIPGLIDMHAHLLLHPWINEGEVAPRYDRRASLDMLRLFLRYGVTTVRDPGAETADAILLRELVRSRRRSDAVGDAHEVLGR